MPNMSDDTLSMFPTLSVDDEFVALLIFPDGVECLRKVFTDLYIAKNWLSEKIFINKRAGVSPTFPFGFQYTIVHDGSPLTLELEH